MQIKYIKSAVFKKDYPLLKKPEIAIVGRSNAGKSSFINALSNSRIAKVSGTPGKTRLLNFFSFGEHYILVDMPGYGFASRSGKEVHDWQQMIEEYLTSRKELVGLILVIDIRREWSKDEELLKSYCQQIGKPLLVVLTKGDKLSKSQILAAQKKMKKDSSENNIFVCSSLKKEGQKEIEEYFFEEWVKPSLKTIKLLYREPEGKKSEGEG